MKLRLNYNENESNIPLILNEGSTVAIKPLENEQVACNMANEHENFII